MSCLYRDKECRVTSRSDAPIPWPGVQPLGQRGGSGLWVDDELVRAIRAESAAALMDWFGVSSKVVWRWREAFGVGCHRSSPGNRKAMHVASLKGAEAVRVKEWTEAEGDRRARAAKERGARPAGRWTPAKGSASRDPAQGTQNQTGSGDAGPRIRTPAAPVVCGHPSITKIAVLTLVPYSLNEPGGRSIHSAQTSPSSSRWRGPFAQIATRRPPGASFA